MQLNYGEKKKIKVLPTISTSLMFLVGSTLNVFGI